MRAWVVRLAAVATGVAERNRACLLPRECREDVWLTVHGLFAESKVWRLAANAAGIGDRPDRDALVIGTREVKGAQQIFDAAETALPRRGRNARSEGRPTEEALGAETVDSVMPFRSRESESDEGCDHIGRRLTIG